MVEPATCRFWQVVAQSGLADAQALQAWWDAIAPEKRTPEQIDRRLAKQGVQSGVLTIWQAQQLLAGRSTGFKIDRYILMELIGQGGMGRVYLARDSKLNRRVALKILSPERVNNPRAIARFHREAMVGAQLQHENLVRIYDEGEANGKCYLVMEYIEGKNIGQMINEGGPLPPAVAARLTRQVALGLEHAQRKGLIHRDVNPYNILVTHDGTAKLTDMGLAIDLGDADHVTRDGATVGTFDYVSPEQARHSHSVDTRSDIYSLGCSLYHMLTGQVPFPTASLPEKLFSHQATVPESVRVLAPWVPEGLAEVVARTLMKSADERYTTPLELAQALEPFAEDTGGTATGPLLNTQPTPSVRGGSEATVTRQFPVAAPVAPPPPAASEPFDLGINLGEATTPKAAVGTSSLVPAPPEPVKTPPSPAPSLASVNVSEEKPLDFGINLGDASTPSEPVGLGINFAAPVVSTPVEKTKPTPVPTPKKAAPPAPAPTPAPGKAPEPKPLDFAIGVGDESASPAPAESLGLGINFDAPATPAPAPAPVAKTKPAPASASKKSAPAPTPPPAQASDSKPLDFEIRVGGEPEAAEPIGLGINLDVPPPKIKPAPEPKSAPRQVVAPPAATAPPAPAPAPPLLFEAPAEAAPGGFGLGVDLGPEPPLTRSAPAKAKPKVETKEEPPAAPAETPKAALAAAHGGRPKWLIPAGVAAGVLVLLGGGGLAYRQFLASPAKTTKTVAKEKPNVKKIEVKPEESGAEKPALAATTPAKMPVKAAPTAPLGDIVVVAHDGSTSKQTSLKDAIRAAIGSKGHVLLQNKTPLVFKAADSLRGAGGMLVIQAGAGVKPVLKVEVKGGTPFLSTRTDAPLKLEGITIEATYVEPGNDPAPMIEAGGAVTLDRCAFRLTSPVAKSRALAVEGEALQADGCWFENFDRALDVACFSGSKATLRQCMMVKTSADDKFPGSAALRLRNMPGGFNKTGRKVTIDRCTVRNGGFLDFAGFSPDAPISVDVTATAVASDFLLTWEPSTTADPRTKDAGAFNPASLKWNGRDNQYDVHSAEGWVRFVATRGAASAPLPDGPKDLNSWSQRLAETATVPPPLKFATDPANLSQTAVPSDFALSDTSVRPRGADPAFVGPGAKPTPKPR